MRQIRAIIEWSYVHASGTYSTVRHAVAWGVVIALCICLSACGGAKPTSSVSRSSLTTPAPGSSVALAAANATPALRHLKGDEDDDDEESYTAGSTVHGDSDNDSDNDLKDNAKKGYYDGDDGSVVTYGHPASTSEAQPLVAFVKRYYAAAARDDGRTTCTMIRPIFAKALPEDYGSRNGPLFLRGAKTCSAVMARLFKQDHRLMASPLVVTSVRVGGGKALVLLGSKTAPASVVELEKLKGALRLIGFSGGPLP